ncbi:MAG: DNA polymerase III subunit gamma/tau [Patescibacteria group bacterium]|jgi:DNA polymerase-3 subunit gamma/tau
MVIYRKYRPQKFSEVIGQDNVVKILENEIKQDKITHAFLLTGPRGLGKTTLSRLIAKSVNCKNRKPGQSEPCNTCENCLDITKGRFLDLIELDAASQTGVDNVRENIIAYSRLPPTIGKYKVFVIDECHMLSTSAFNALLKTLEEPPSYVIFILATTEIHKLPETIISRCQRFDLTKVPIEKIFNRLKNIMKLEKIKIDDEILKIVARRSEGYVRDAESLMSQILALGGEEITMEEASLVIPPTQTKLHIEFIDLIINDNSQEAVKMVNHLLDEGVDLEQFITDLIEFLRKMILVKIGAIKDDFWEQFDDVTTKKMKEFGEKIETKKLITIIDEFIKTKIQLGYSEIPQLPIELAVLKLCQTK